MVSRTSLVCCLFVASALGESMWGPSDSVQVLDIVINAVNKVVATPGLTHDQALHLKSVGDEIKLNIDEVEHNKNLTKAQAHAKVGVALQELAGLQAELQKEQKERRAAMEAFDKMPKNDAAAEEKLAQMEKELADKKSSLAKDESMIKLYNLQKELIEKKLKLQKLLAQKSNSQDTKAQQVEQGKKESEMVDKVLAASSSMKANTELPAPLKAALADLKTRGSKLSSEIEAETGAETKYEATLDKQMKEIPAKESKEDLAKEKKMIKSLKAEEKRKFRKNEASKKIELGEIKEAETAIEKRDSTALTKVMGKMQREAKALQAKSGDFLH